MSLDIVLIGTGASAILLAESLIKRSCFRTLRIIGPKKPLRAHRFSYWSEAPTPFDDFADGNWSELRIVPAVGEPISVTLERNVYRTFRAHEWAAAAWSRHSATPGVEWIEARVDRISNDSDGAVAYIGPDRVRGDWVFSSARLHGFQPSCWQRFEGWEVDLESDDVDRRAATLLDFRTPADGDFRFLYALPLGKRRLFLEHVSYLPCDHAAPMKIYLEKVLGLRGWTVTDRERGATATFRDPPERVDGRIVHIGVAAGLAKPTTGYALMRMWRDAESIAAGLQRDGRPVIAPLPGWLHRVADHFFVDQVERAPTRLAELVPALFRGATGDAVLSFLDDRAGFLEQLSVALTTPRWLRWLLKER